MLSKSLVLALALFASAAVAEKLLAANNEANVYAFNQFKADFSKKYDTPEAERAAFAAFAANLALADERNAAEKANGGSAVHGITKFMDLTPEEFKNGYLNSVGKEKTDAGLIGLAKPVDATINVDWRGVYTTPVKNQGYCGSCWAFSATEQIESDCWMQTGQEFILAPQQITSCDKTSFGCNGGLTERAYEYVIRAGGLDNETEYPYTSGTAGITGQCDPNRKGPAVTIGGYTTVSSSASGETSAMASYIAETGPMSICVDAQTGWQTYTSGILTVCGKTVDHCVQAVGLNTAASTPYWIVRNSWGVTWGQAGYIYLEYGKNLCELASDATITSGCAIE